ncbi:MAG: acyl--CoA ligase [Planctomycetes bacterium]|nr:acyl--CoA ligase [Planctomycetota bacterium]
MQINHFLENSARSFPEKPAVWFQGEWKTYAQIDAMANRLANYLLSGGIERGDRVAILYKNSYEYIASYFGVLKAGCVTVALNTETTTQALVYLLNHSKAKAIVSQGKYLKLLLPAIKKTPGLKHVIIEHKKPDNCIGPESSQKAACLSEIFENGDETQPNVKTIDIDLASIVYTSGSAGKPKGVMLTHQNIVHNTLSIVKYLELTKDDRIMVVLPFYYIYGQSLLTTHFCVSGSVVIENRLVYPQISLETMRDTEATGFAGVPSTFLILLDRTTVRQFDFPKLRYVTQAGGPMAPRTQKEVAEVFSRSELFIMYGATEAGPRLTYVPPERLTEKFGSIGRAVDNVEVFVADDHGNRLSPGQEGEIVARGSNIMAGYWRDPEGTAEVLRNGIYYTGDLGIMDYDGYFYIVGRKKEIIKSGGFRVSSKEVEEALLEHTDIHEVAVVGVVDEIFGEAIKAFVVPKSGITLYVDVLKKHLRKILPAFKHPRYFEIMESLPRNPSGKIMKTKLI